MAEQENDINAKFQLGYCYDKGIGTEINKAKAFDLYNIAAEKGSNEALYNLSFYITIQFISCQSVIIGLLINFLKK